MTGLLYVARPIDRADPLSDDMVWVAKVEQALLRHRINSKFGFYHPNLAFRVAEVPPEPYVRQINNTALLFSSALLAIWPADAKSWGVPAEVERAITLDKPVVVLTNGPRTWSMVDDQIESMQVVGEGAIDGAARTALQHLRLKVDEKGN